MQENFSTGIAHPVVGPHFRGRTVTSGRRSLEAGIEKDAGLCLLIYIFCKYIWVVFICIRVMKFKLLWITFIQVVCWVELPEQMRLCPIFCGNMDPDKWDTTM